MGKSYSSYKNRMWFCVPCSLGIVLWRNSYEWHIAGNHAPDCSGIFSHGSPEVGRDGLGVGI